MAPQKLIPRLTLAGLLLILALLFAACVPLPGQPGQMPPTATPLPPASTPTPPTQAPAPTPWPPAQRAIAILAQALGISPDAITLVSSEPVDWPDGCLGVSRPGVMCTQAIVPGYRVILEAGGQRYEVRTDRSGTAAVLVPPEQATPADPPAVLAARTAIAVQLGLELALVRAVSVEPMTWPDGCLGVAQPDEMCTQALVPGYRIVVEANAARYVLHTDETGVQVRVAPLVTQEPAVVALLRDLIAGQLGIEADAVQLIALEAVEWPDACLGVRLPDIGCAQVVTPGFKIMLEAEDRRFTYHTDATGDSIMLAEETDVTAPAPAAAILWQGTGPGGCAEARITAASVTYGACGAAAMSAPLLAEFDRPAQLANLVAAYASFAANTPAGKVVFTGKGAAQPTPAEQRMIAYWAAGVAEEARAGSYSASGLAINWQRRGGIAGFCDDLSIYLNGLAYGINCRSQAREDGQPLLLTEAELAQLYNWVDVLGSFEYKQQDQAVADAMTITLAFTGAGTGTPSDAEKQAIAAFAAQIMARWAQ